LIDAGGNPESVLLVGGTSEIGLAIVARFAAARRLRVVLAARATDRLDAAVDRLRRIGCDVAVVPFDARFPDTHTASIDKAFSGGELDLCIIAFGMLGDQERAWTDLDAAIELIDVNYTGAVSVGVLIGRRLAEQGHGQVVALSSVAGQRARRADFVYGSAKAGMDTFYSGLGDALREFGVRVLVVRAGFVHTRLTAGRRPAAPALTADQAAEAVVEAIRSRRELVWTPASLRLLSAVMRHLPRPLHRHLTRLR
jgi:decaprenylphospho-beta-D-erythro-pentofuranosid-2-ulose 2-reductase